MIHTPLTTKGNLILDAKGNTIAEATNEQMAQALVTLINGAAS